MLTVAAVKRNVARLAVEAGGLHTRVGALCLVSSRPQRESSSNPSAVLGVTFVLDLAPGQKGHIELSLRNVNADKCLGHASSS